jgi:hypothetical protein
MIEDLKPRRYGPITLPGESLRNDDPAKLVSGLLANIETRRKRYKYCRNRLPSFREGV